MGAVLTANQTTTRMVRLINGELIVEDMQPNLYMVPPKGEYEVEITGYALPFEMKKADDWIRPGESEMQTMTRLELTLTDTNAKGAGRMCNPMFGFSIGQKSNLGKFLRGFGVDLTPRKNPQTGQVDWDLDYCIGYVGKAYLFGSDKLDEGGKPKYTKVNLDSLEAVSKPTKEYRITITEAAPAATNGNGNGNGHHAASDDGWE